MLKRVSIQNFKSLKDVTLDLQKVNLLIGPNNSGKTNFLKALEYMDKDNTNQQEQDYKRLIFRLSEGESISIDLYYDHIKDYDVEIIFSCQISSSENIERSRDIIQHNQRSKGTTLHYNPEELKAKIRPVIIYKPDTNKLDKPSPVGRGDASVIADASNLIAFFDRIRDEYPATFAQIKIDLAKCVPEFTEINFQNVESTPELVKQFGDKTFKRIGLTNERQKTIYWADELSEGTLYFIALLCIINQPNPPKLLLLEEPEKGIHPRRIREVMDFIFRLADEKDIQIILTTHNENVLNEFTSMPEAVFVFSKDEEGATHVKNLQRDIIEPSNQRSRETGTKEIDFTSNLGESWMYGLLGGVPEESL
ncbi:AAA family ATPase [Spirosoma sp. HMF4905]|uniref:AAA family ATPase n=1 Tax=Spirosoma arboris TaxID=2682092 RepID=A0A7K1SN32_9BACT|nr:ATP-binding protein [Spirosoma arboris]MVM35083.1 AAA family ATPase [Spirosoma arboris]